MSETPRQPAPRGPVIVGVIPGQPREVLTQSVMFAQALGTRLVCAWVDPSSYLGPAEPDGTRELVPLDPDVYESTTEQAGGELEAELRQQLDTEQVDWTFKTLAGDPARSIAALASRRAASLIVVGTREPGFGARLEELLSGSVAVHLAQHQRCPVLVIPLHPRPYNDVNPVAGKH